MRRGSSRNTTQDSARRAEEIRRRRTSRSQERVSQASNRISNPATARPVIVRGKSFESDSGGFKNVFRSTPLYRQAGTRPRRQFYVAVDSATGSELRLPAIPFFNPGWRVISAILVVLAAMAVYSLWNSPFFRVYTVDVQGLQRLNGADLQAVLHLENLSIIEIQPQQVKDALAIYFPELADINVQVSLPNVVTITARERQPILAWKMGDNIRWIDAEGYIFPARGEGAMNNGGEGSPALVTINTSDEIPLAPLSAEETAALQALAEASTTGANPQITTNLAPGLLTNGGAMNNGGIIRKADLKLLNASLQLIQKLPEGTEVVYDQMNGLGWNDPQGWQVFVGKDLENFEAKFALYEAITNELGNQGIHPNLISVQHLNAPFYRAEQATEQ